MRASERPADHHMSWQSDQVGLDVAIIDDRGRVTLRRHDPRGPEL
jgi:hypothetical protein